VKKIVVIQGHPARGSFGEGLAEAYARGARGAGAQVEQVALGELDFDPVLRGGFGGEQELEPDLVAAREAIERADHVVFEFPVWWGTLPALLKGFIDRVFLPGWAFQNTGKALPEGLLAGRTARVLATMDSPRIWYALKHRRAAHRALTHATLNYVGISKVWETTAYSVRGLDAAGRQAWIERAAALGARDAALRTRT
jgi:putative NADPH-quinone reductase